MKGKVIFFNPQKGFGKISNDEQTPQEVFIHFTQIQGDAKILLPDEEVEFETETSAKGLQAKNLDRLQERYIGIVEDFTFGHGFIKSSNEKYFIHHSDVVGEGFKKIENGYEVEFSPDASEKGLIAKKIVVRDTRTAMDKFAFFQNWDESINELKNISQTEDGDWDYIKNKTGKFPVLESYISYTFLRLQKENKIKYATKEENGKDLKFACFNTGLATSKQEEIFAYFEHVNNMNYSISDRGYLKNPQWTFRFFDRESNRLMNNFAEKPELANYFQNAGELIYDSSKRLIPDFEHILDDREKRFPESFRNLGKPLQVERVKSAIDAALTRIKRNYKTAIPQFYDDSIQLLLPLCLEDVEIADVALVVANEGEVYRANTILPLDWAYNNARLLAKPDREWLNP